MGAGQQKKRVVPYDFLPSAQKPAHPPRTTESKSESAREAAERTMADFDGLFGAITRLGQKPL